MWYVTIYLLGSFAMYTLTYQGLHRITITKQWLLFMLSWVGVYIYAVLATKALIATLIKQIEDEEYDA